MSSSLFTPAGIVFMILWSVPGILIGGSIFGLTNFISEKYRDRSLHENTGMIFQIAGGLAFIAILFSVR